MSQKNTRQYYKISSLSPPFIQSPISRTQRNKSFSTNRIQNINIFSNFIEQLPQEYKDSIQFTQENKNQTNCTHQRMLSYNEIGGRQCKPFKNKIKLKKNQLDRHSNLLDRKQEISQNQVVRQQYLDNKTKSNFVEQYRINLRRTVFNQTKMMIKNKKNKLKYDFYAVDETMKLKEYSKQFDNSKIFANKNSFHSHKIKFGSQKISGPDTMYKTIGKKNTNQPQIIYRQLDVARFPLLMRSKNGSSSHQNYSNLLMTLNMKQNDIKQVQRQEQNKKKKKRDRSVTKDINFQKQEIRPWQTYADQFMD